MSGGRAVVRILLIEDNPGDVFLVREALRSRGLEFELHHYADGDQAWQFLCERPPAGVPDLILLDLNLPKTDGSSLLKLIREHDHLQDIPVAVLTSSQSPHDEQEAVRIGANRYLHKSAFLDDFLNEVGCAVSEMLAGRRAT